MLLRCLALASAPWGALALPTSDSGQLPDLPADDACEGVAEGECSLSFRQLRGELKTQLESSPDGPAASSSCFVLAPEGTLPPFSDEEIGIVRGRFLENVDIGGSGAVVAAPDNDTGPGGNYVYHWERDGALSMSALLSTSGLTDEVDERFKHYVKWVKSTQEQPDAHSGTDVRVEPKYEIPAGGPYAGEWCRPQTDGPGLRAKALGEYALAMLDKADGRKFVLDNLWASNSSDLEKRLVSWDLDWVVNNWRQAGCDLWEEIVSADFFWGRYTMRAGLHVGAKLASALGDQQAHDLYLSTIRDIEKTLIKDHWTGTFINQCRNSVPSPFNDNSCSTRERDSAVIEAINVGHVSDDYLPLLSNYVLGTVITLNSLFCEEYPINREDSKNGVPGVLYGRYSGDTYQGGNPWVLLTTSLARLIYRQATAVAQAEAVSDETYGLLQQAYGVPAGLAGPALAAALVRAGDGVLLRLKSHLPESLHMREQLDRKTGKPIAAQDLTWNYANMLLALDARSDAAAAA